MPLQAFLTGLVLIPALLLVALIWWRFFGGGKGKYKKPLPPDLNRYLTIRKYRYDVSDFVKPVVPKPEAPRINPEENIIQKLVDNTTRRAAYEEEHSKSPSKLIPDKEKTGSLKTSAPTGEFTEDLFPEIGPQKDKPVSTHPEPALRSSVNPEDEHNKVAPSLFYNVVTAPASTSNDIRNRQAVSEHRTRKGSALRAKLTNQKEALGDLFLGNPATVKPGADSQNGNQ
ncbi:hypothetical protein [Adhaeribacter rhizoryzae]|uniref:Uncharacterized protein n=1 Tax=Adhaeribacter rhizoryzae TaxID=2607907 RepID=A0A5M6CX27_9BACT|nr:hypothetical protein [Adhaeribacter rhizoryzae]KAA5539643.1 hypothetical protein F0145_23950 [Adhaeribacter rhizoryzae]